MRELRELRGIAAYLSHDLECELSQVIDDRVLQSQVQDFGSIASIVGGVACWRKTFQDRARPLGVARQNTPSVPNVLELQAIDLEVSPSSRPKSISRDGSLPGTGVVSPFLLT